MSGVAAILGAGTIGTGWAARFLLMGWDLRVFDPDQTALQHRLEEGLAKARASLPGLYDLPLPSEGRLTICTSISEAVAGATWIQESLPERLPLKRKLLQQVQAHCAQNAIIASSSATFSAREIQGCATRKAQIIIAQALDPVYLLPLVELGGSEETPAQTLDLAHSILTGIGMHPLRLQNDAQGSIASRLREAVSREALSMIEDKSATADDIDAVIRHGIGPLWAQAGPFEADAAENDARRDGHLVTVLRGLKARGAGVGQWLRAHEQSLETPAPDCTTPPVTLRRQVPQDWVDYNGHMNEARFLQAFSNACDKLLEWAGLDADVIASGSSVFTVETHMQHLGEVDIGEVIHVTTRVLQGGGKKFHIWQEMWKGSERVASCEQLLLHVDLSTRRSAPPPDHVAQALQQMMQDHDKLPSPSGLGRAVGERRG